MSAGDLVAADVLKPGIGIVDFEKLQIFAVRARRGLPHDFRNRNRRRPAARPVFCNWLSKLLLEELTAFTAVAQADGETLTVYEADVDVIHTIAALQESPRLWRAQ
jgi:hypothetical protein